MADATADAPPDRSTPRFNLRLVSPSFPNPLNFNEIEVTTTVKELKEKIKDVLPTNHTNDVQRLIHQGRLLAEESDTMERVFGDMLTTGFDPAVAVTLHLVLRPQDVATFSHLPQVAHMSASHTGTIHRHTVPASAPETISEAGQPRVLPLPQQLVTIAHAQQMMHNQRLATLEAHNQQLTQQLAPSVRRLHELRLLQAEGERLQQELVLSTQRIREHIERTRNEPSLSSDNSHVASQQNGTTVSSQAAGVQNGLELQSSIDAASVNGASAQPQRQIIATDDSTPIVASQPQFQPGIQHFSQHQQGVHTANQFPPRNTAAGGSLPPSAFQSTVGGLAPPPLGVNSNATAAGLPLPTSSNQGIYVPDVRTFRHETIGQNGERWQVTVNTTTTTLQNGNGAPVRSSPAPDAQLARDVQGLLRHHDRHARLHGSLPSSRQGTPQPQAFALTSVPGVPSRQLGQTQRSTTAPAPATLNGLSAVNMIGENPTSSTADTPPIVYLLSSPQGPRALLLRGAESYYTPRVPSNRNRSAPGMNAIQNQLQSFLTPGSQAANTQGQSSTTSSAPAPATGVRNMGSVRHQRVAQPMLAPPVDAAAPAPAADGAEAAHAPAAVPGGAAAQNNLAAQMAPHVWLAIRLAAFVWFFLSGDRSWYRWITISGLAVVFFLANLGVFNGLATRFWDPLRRHLENLLPLAPPPAVDPPAGNAGAADNQPAAQAGVAPPAEGSGAARAGRRPEPSPAQVAARLIEQRRQRRGNPWIMQQLRRLEHAMLLFLASLVPGVGERHIMARAEQENAVLEAERARRAAEEERDRLLAGAAAGVAENSAARSQTEVATADDQSAVSTATAAGDPTEGLRQRSHVEQAA